MSIAKEIVINICGDTDKLGIIAYAIGKKVTDVTVRAEQTIRIENSSCIRSTDDLCDMAISIISVAADVWFDIQSVISDVRVRLYYEYSVLRMERLGDFVNVPIPEGLISINNLVDDLETFYETAGFADYYDRVLSDMSDEEIREFHKLTFEVYIYSD